MNYDSSKSGKYYSMQDGLVYVINSAGDMAYSGTGKEGTVIILLTGYYLTTKRGSIAYQTTNGGYIFLNDGWEEYSQGTVTSYSQSQAQRLVNRIIANNKKIIANNILCARFSNKLNKEQQQKLYDLQLRLQQRNASLQNDGICTNMQTSYPEGYVYLQTYLDEFMTKGISGIGIAISTVVTIIVSAVVIAGLGTAAYYAYKAYADESERDVKYSEELTKILTEKLTDEEYQQLLDETRGIVTKARIKASLSSYGNLLKYGAVLAAGAGLYYLLKMNK